MLTDRFDGRRLYPDHIWRDVLLLERQIAQIEAREPDALTGPALEALRKEVEARREQIKVSVLEK